MDFDESDLSLSIAIRSVSGAAVINLQTIISAKPFARVFNGFKRFVDKTVTTAASTFATPVALRA